MFDFDDKEFEDTEEQGNNITAKNYSQVSSMNMISKQSNNKIINKEFSAAPTTSSKFMNDFKVLFDDYKF